MKKTKTETTTPPPPQTTAVASESAAATVAPGVYTRQELEAAVEAAVAKSRREEGLARLLEAVVVCPSCGHAASRRLDDLFPVKG